MNTINVDYDLYNLEDGNRYLVNSKNGYYKIDKISFKILEDLKKKKSFKDIADAVNYEFGINYYSEDDIVKICYNEMKGIIVTENDFKNDNLSSATIFFRVNLIKPANALKFYQSFNFLFHKKIYLVFLYLSVAVSFFYIIHCYLLNYKENLISSNSLSHICAIFFLFPILFFHEIGHAVASIKYGIKPKGIGFGFYFIFPVFYTDITAIWILDRRKRIQINMAGIYFQLLVNMILVISHYFFLANTVLTMLISFNILSIVLSFNPFFKYDGYWIVSDYFNIPNLSKRSKECLIIIRKFIVRPRKMFSFLKQQPNTLVTYSILNFIFWTYFLTNLFYSLFFKIKILFIEIRLAGWSLGYSANAFGLLLTFILLTYISLQKIKK